MEYRFFSTDDLNAETRKWLLPGPKWIGDNEFPIEKVPFLKEFFDCIENDVKVYFTIKDTLALELGGHLPGFSILLLRIWMSI